MTTTTTTLVTVSPDGTVHVETQTRRTTAPSADARPGLRRCVTTSGQLLAEVIAFPARRVA